MKKLLSILPIGSAVASTTPGISACSTNSTATKLDLTKIHVTGIGVTFDRDRLAIDVISAYNQIVSEIINGYNNIFAYAGKHLKTTDFIYGSSKDLAKPVNKGKSWAIQIMDGYKQPMPNTLSTSSSSRRYPNRKPNLPAPPTPLNHHYKSIPPKPIAFHPIFPYTRNKVKKEANVLLKNNALDVNIYTTNKNFQPVTTTAHIYLNRFVYSSKNINQGYQIYKPSSRYDPSTNVPELKHAFDVSSTSGIKVYDNTTADDIIASVQQIAGTNRINISSQVITALNYQLREETQTLKEWDVLNPDDFAKINTGDQINFRYTDPIIYELDPNTGAFAEIRGISKPAVGDLIYVRLLNLGLQHYINNANAYLYLKIAKVIAHPVK